MDCHLVTIEVGVVSGADQRMNANGFAFNELGLEGLDRQAMQGRRAIQQYRMAFGDFFENVPYFGGLAFDHLFSAAHGVHIAEFLEPADDEWLKQDQRHFLRQPALMQLQFRTDNDHRTTGVIDAFAQQVLAETAALPLEHVG